MAAAAIALRPCCVGATNMSGSALVDAIPTGRVAPHLQQLGLRCTDRPLDLHPSFSATHYLYNVRIDFAAGSFAIDAVPAEGMRILNAAEMQTTKLIAPGAERRIDIGVVSTENVTMKYTILVKRLDGTDVKLRRLELPGAELTPVFDADITDYFARLPVSRDHLALRMVLWDTGQTLETRASPGDFQEPPEWTAARSAYSPAPPGPVPVSNAVVEAAQASGDSGLAARSSPEALQPSSPGATLPRQAAPADTGEETLGAATPGRGPASEPWLVPKGSNGRPGGKGDAGADNFDPFAAAGEVVAEKQRRLAVTAARVGPAPSGETQDAVIKRRFPIEVGSKRLVTVRVKPADGATSMAQTYRLQVVRDSCPAHRPYFAPDAGGCSLTCNAGYFPDVAAHRCESCPEHCLRCRAWDECQLCEPSEWRALHFVQLRSGYCRPLRIPWERILEALGSAIVALSLLCCCLAWLCSANGEHRRKGAAALAARRCRRGHAWARCSARGGEDGAQSHRLLSVEGEPTASEEERSDDS